MSQLDPGHCFLEEIEYEVFIRNVSVDSWLRPARDAGLPWKLGPEPDGSLEMTPGLVKQQNRCTWDGYRHIADLRYGDHLEDDDLGTGLVTRMPLRSCWNVGR
jgi:hypothetical protein